MKIIKCFLITFEPIHRLEIKSGNVATMQCPDIRVHDLNKISVDIILFYTKLLLLVATQYSTLCS